MSVPEWHFRLLRWLPKQPMYFFKEHFMSAILEPLTHVTTVSSKADRQNNRCNSDRLSTVAKSTAAAEHQELRRHSVDKWVGYLVIVGIVLLIGFSTYECGRAINPLNRQQANAQWVNLLIRNFNPNTPVTPFNGNQWAQF